MRQSAEDEIDAVQRRVIGRNKGDVASGNSDRSAALLVRRRKRQGESRVTENECAELAARVTAGPEHTDWNLIHP
jgi:hypothetical protein